jgi:hypothetical protein
MSQPPGPPPPPQYGAYPPPAPAPPTNTLAIIALVCAFVFAPAGIICGIIARRQIRQTGESGDGLALAAIIVSAVQLVLGLLAIVFLIIGLVAFGTAVSHLPSPSPFPS